MKRRFWILLVYFSLLNFPLLAQTWDERPEVSFITPYDQDFTTGTWDHDTFYDQWLAVEPGIFTASDISSGFLQFEWVRKRIIVSKLTYSPPNYLEAETGYGGGSNRGGIVIRAKGDRPDILQEPADGDPGFNSEGIAFYPSSDGSSMIVQFTGPYAQYNTPVERIFVPKPAGVSSMKARGVIRIEDYGTSIYIFYNDDPFVRIDLSGKDKGIYTSGTVYDAQMDVVGTISNMEVESTGKVAVCQRDATLQLYRIKIGHLDLLEQSISFEPVGTKKTTDPPFKLDASATSGLPVEFKVLSGPATIDGDTLTLSGESGLVTVEASQDGNDAYFPALSLTRIFYVSEPGVGSTPAVSQDYTDDWVVTDALGRELPAYSEAGPKREEKYVGVFYYVWSGAHGDKVYEIPEILESYPSDPLSPNNPAWGPVNAAHHWGEPEYGYFRSEDPWVLRRDLQMLSNAHVDFLYLDVTNAVIYLETVKALCEVSMEMRADGIHTPQIVFTTHSQSGRTVNSLYDAFYSHRLFEELWFYWEGKPLILGDPDDSDLRPEVKDFFTMRFSWAWTDAKNEPGHWQWVDIYPQDYGWSSDPDVPEQVPVATASHPTTTMGKSYHDGNQPPVDENYVTDYTGQGLHFSEQWERAHTLDPSVVMVTQWNEWIAGRFIWDQGDGIYAGRPIENGDSYFVDAFSQEFNRDMAPMKGGHTDNYYYQLIANIRKFKGMSAPEPASEGKTIVPDGDFAEWTAVKPVFEDPPGDTMHRDFAGYDPTTTFTNTTGRNDIIESRVTYDEDHVYFYVKTRENLSPAADPNWMLLFIDGDKNKATGWEGYEWMVNKSTFSASEASLQEYNGNSWGEASVINFSANGNELEMAIPRGLINMESGKPDFYFKWADNPQHLDDITAFFTDGDAAPDRRFNYYFNSDVSTGITEDPSNQDIPEIYPNPASLNVHIKTPEKSRVEVFSIAGRKIYSRKIPAGIHEINVSEWVSGWYLVKIRMGNRTCNRKLTVD